MDKGLAIGTTSLNNEAFAVVFSFIKVELDNNKTVEQMRDADFDRIVDEYSNSLYGYLFKLLFSKEDVEDVMQSAFLSLYDRMPSINPAKYPAYLFRMARNKALNHLKKEKKYTRYLDFSHGVPVVESDDTEKEARERRLLQAMRLLKPKELLALELQYYQKKSYKEIAEIMETTQNAVDSMLVRAKKKLREILQDK